MKILHIVPGINDIANGMVVVAKLLAQEQGDAEAKRLHYPNNYRSRFYSLYEAREDYW